MNDNDDAKARFERARRMRNYALGGTLLFLVILFFLMTLVRLGQYVGS